MKLFWFSRRNKITPPPSTEQKNMSRKRRIRPAQRSRPSVHLELEMLEGRALPSTAIWTGAVDYDWFTAGNWSIQSVPGPNDDVVVANGADYVQIDGAAQAAGVTVSAGTLNINSGTLSSGSVSVSGGYFLSYGSVTVDNLSLSASGNITMQADLTAGDLTMSGGTFYMLWGNLSIGGGTLSAGTLPLPDGSQITGVFEQTGGTLEASGTVQFGTGAELVLSGGQFDGGYGFTASGDGQVVVAYGGTFTVDGSYTVSNITLEAGGTINGYGDLYVTDQFIWTGGTMEGTGTTQITEGATMSIDGPNAMTLNQRTLTIDLGASASLNGGTLTADGGSIIEHAGDFLFQGGNMVLQNAQMVIPVSNNLDNNNQGSLRWAINQVRNGQVSQTINLAGRTGTITLTQALPDLDVFDHTVTITGPGSFSLTITRSTAAGTPQFRIFYVRTGTTANISGLVLTNGHAGLSNGGGVYNFAGTVTLTDMAIRENFATNGGGVYNSGGTMTISNSYIESNQASGVGGGISNNGNLTVHNTRISLNSANDNGNIGGGGGGLFNNASGIATLISTIIDTNQTNGHGGGINNWGSLTMTGGVIDYNSATGNGGAIYNRSGTASLTNVDILYNGAGNNGGGFYVHDGQNSSLTLDGCTVSGNTVTNGVGPGGSWKPGFTPNIINCNISDTLAQDNS